MKQPAQFPVSSLVRAPRGVCATHGGEHNIWERLEAAQRDTAAALAAFMMSCSSVSSDMETRRRS